MSVSVVEEPSSTCRDKLPQEDKSSLGLSTTLPGKPAASTHWVGFVHIPRDRHPSAKRCWPPPAEQRKIPVPQLVGNSLPSQEPYRAQHADYPAFLGSLQGKQLQAALQNYPISSQEAAHA